MIRFAPIVIAILIPFSLSAQNERAEGAGGAERAVGTVVGANHRDRDVDVSRPGTAIDPDERSASSSVRPAGGAEESRGVLFDENDPCGFALRRPGDLQQWGYGRDTLLADLQRWTLSPKVIIDVIGSSVQGRPLYHMVLTNPASQLRKKRIWIHARTHPNESESSYVARAVVDELLGGSALGSLLLDHAYVHVLPMLNIDGVELRYPRENANGVDIESNWSAASPEPEVEALRRHLTALMNSSAPVDVALNLHSAWDCKRYFVYHAIAGTSELYSQLQRRFIDFARARFPGGIEPYDYFVSWTGGTPNRYPESWFWLNHGDRVMALTYEDMNCAAAGDYDRTARALLGAAGDYLGLTDELDVETPAPASVPGLAVLADLYPNPVQGNGRISVRLAASASARPLRVRLHDALGRAIALLYDGEYRGDGHTLVVPTAGLAPGTYYVRAVSGDASDARSFLLLR